MKTAFICDYCNRHFDSLREALEHESAHWTSYQVDDSQDEFTTDRLEPDTITVTLVSYVGNDGSYGIQYKKAKYKYIGDVEGSETNEG